MSKRSSDKFDHSTVKIHVVCSNRWNSAITEYALSLCQALKDEFDVVFTPLRSSPAEKRALAMGLHVMPMDDFKPTEFDRFRYLCERVKAEITITCGGKESALLSLRKKRSSETWLRFRGDAFAGSYLKRKLFGLSLKKFDALLLPSQKLKEEALGLGIKNAYHATIGLDVSRYTFMDSDEAEQVVRSEFPYLRSEDRHLLVFGRLDPVKGHSDFIRLFAKILEIDKQRNKTSSSDLRLIIAGREENTRVEDLKAVAETHGIVDSVVFITGTVDSVSALMGFCDVGVVSSLGSEQICRVAQEFLLCGTPVAVSGVGATSETLCHPSFGFQYDPQNVDTAAAQFNDHLATSFLARPAQNAKAYVDANAIDKRARSDFAKDSFSLKAMGERLREILRDLSIYVA